MDANSAELAGYGLSPIDLAGMLQHHQRWEQGLPDAPPNAADIAPFNKLSSLAHWRSDVLRETYRRVSVPEIWIRHRHLSARR